MHREFKDRGLRVMAIDIEENPRTVTSWVAAHDLSFTVLLDTDGQVTRAYEVTATPTVFIVARDGRVVGKALGTKEWTSGSGQALLQALVR